MEEKTFIYRLSRFFAYIISKCFINAKFVGIENIPNDGRCILAGNHISGLDCFLIVSCTKRNVHFLAKKELMEGSIIKKFYFKKMGIIPVDRNIKDKSVIPSSERVLNEEKIIGIFPEGTTEKGKGLLDFKVGAVKIANETGSPIIPFAIKGKYKLFSKRMIIEFDKPIYVKNNNLVLENAKLRNKIKEILER